MVKYVAVAILHQNNMFASARLLFVECLGWQQLEGESI